MIGLLIGALAAPAAAAAQIPDTVPIYCLDDDQVAQPVQRTSYASLAAAFRRELGLGTRQLTRSSGHDGRLTFRGGEGGTESVFYEVEPFRGANGLGIMLTGMHVRLRGASDDLAGAEMCWQTFSIVHGQ